MVIHAESGRLLKKSLKKFFLYMVYTRSFAGIYPVCLPR